MSRAISVDGVPVYIGADVKECANESAMYIASLIQRNPQARISFATGQTMIPVYERLVEIVQRDEIDCSHIECFHLDEYFPCSEEESHSFVKYLRQRIVRPLFLSEGQFHFLNGRATDPNLEAKRYDVLLHDLDLSIVGIGPHCHIGFNETGASAESRTRLVELAAETIARDHQERGQTSPTQALTQGVANVLHANRVILIAFGDKKAEIMRMTLRENISENCPASLLRVIPQKSQIFLDEAAAKLL